jgi:hypothetical protein
MARRNTRNRTLQYTMCGFPIKMSTWTGKILIIIGTILLLTGILLLFKDSLPFLKYLGRLPGDITIERKNFSFHFPVVTGIIISVILSLILYVINKLR